MDDDHAKQAVENMGLVFGLLTARNNDDIKGFYSLLGGSEDGTADARIVTEAMLGLADFAIAQLGLQSAITGMSVSTLLQTLSMISNIAMPEIIQKRERGY